MHSASQSLRFRVCFSTEFWLNTWLISRFCVCTSWATCSLGSCLDWWLVSPGSPALHECHPPCSAQLRLVWVMNEVCLLVSVLVESLLCVSCFDFSPGLPVYCLFCTPVCLKIKNLFLRILPACECFCHLAPKCGAKYHRNYIYLKKKSKEKVCFWI